MSEITIDSLNNARDHILSHIEEGCLEDASIELNSVGWAIGLATGLIKLDDSEADFFPAVELAKLLTDAITVLEFMYKE